MKLPLITINAFAPGPFQGNLAAVVMSQSPLAPATMQAIAAQNNLAETAFLTPYSGVEADYGLRWFTPTVEVPLCGHATLASAHALVGHLGFTEPQIRFATQDSGILTAKSLGNGTYELGFPAHAQTARDLDSALAALAFPIQSAFEGPFLMLVLDSAETVATYEPDLAAILALDKEVIITAQGSGDWAKYDFVSRMFAPNIGIDEDPVTGSAHCQLTPYWADALGKTILQAAQIGPRSGAMEAELLDGRVLMRGRAETYASGELNL